MQQYLVLAHDRFLRDCGRYDSGFHKMATAGGQIKLEPYPKEIIPYDNYRCWTCCGYYCLRWIQSPVVKTDKIVHQMEANAVDL
jgi:hypothetical protein